MRAVLALLMTAAAIRLDPDTCILEGKACNASDNGGPSLEEKLKNEREIDEQHKAKEEADAAKAGAGSESEEPSKGKPVELFVDLTLVLELLLEGWTAVVRSVTCLALKNACVGVKSNGRGRHQKCKYCSHFLLNINGLGFWGFGVGLLCWLDCVAGWFALCCWLVCVDGWFALLVGLRSVLV